MKKLREITVNFSSHGLLNSLRRLGELRPDIVMDHFPYRYTARQKSGALISDYTITTKTVTISHSFGLAFGTVNREHLFPKLFQVSAMPHMRKPQV
jgi:hypothetical protein